MSRGVTRGSMMGEREIELMRLVGSGTFRGLVSELF